MLWHKQSDKHIHVKKRDHNVGRSGVGAVDETINIFDGKGGCAGASRERRDASFEAYVGVGHAWEQGFHEFVHLLASLAGRACVGIFVPSGDTSHPVLWLVAIAFAAWVISRYPVPKPACSSSSSRFGDGSRRPSPCSW